MKKRITITDVAREAGVVPSTVSNVVNGSKNVTPETREAVLQAIAKLNYQPNPVARALISGRYRMIGVLTSALTSTYHNVVLASIEGSIAVSDYHLMIACSESYREPIHAIDLLLQRGAEAIICLAGYPKDERLLTLASRIPLVVINSLVPRLENRCLTVDDENGGYLAARHLIALGHERIAYMGARHYSGAVARQMGYQRALAERGLTVDPSLIISGEDNADSGYRLTGRLLNQGHRFTAIMAANDETAYGVMSRLHHARLRVPEDVSVVGYDDTPHSQYAIPPLTTVRQPISMLGEIAVKAVIAILSGQEPVLPVLPVELVERASTAAPNFHR
jgi:LacI family transcriptional regulator